MIRKMRFPAVVGGSYQFDVHAMTSDFKPNRNQIQFGKMISTFNNVTSVKIRYKTDLHPKYNVQELVMKAFKRGKVD
jgi:hypothetical protein